jgi:hypothetical protein
MQIAKGCMNVTGMKNALLSTIGYGVVFISSLDWEVSFWFLVGFLTVRAATEYGEKAVHFYSI